MIFKAFTTDDLKEWNETCASFPMHSIPIFHCPDYLQTWQGYEKGEPYCLYARIGDYQFLYPFFKRRIDEYSTGEDYYDIFSVYGYGGVVTNDYRCNGKFLTLLNDAIDKWCKEENVIAEFVREYPVNKYIRRTKKSHVRNNLILEYDNKWQDFTKLIKKRARRDAMASLKKGCKGKVDTELKSMDGFIGLYRNLCRGKWLPEYYNFPDTYFENVKNKLEKWSFIINVHYHKKVIASSFNFMMNGSIVYHLSASDYQYKNYLPNDLMLYTLIEFGAHNKCRNIFFGGGLTKAKNDSLYRFKEKFANVCLPVHIGTKVHNEKVYEMLCTKWAEEYPEKAEQYRDYFLKYRLQDIND